MEDYSIEEMRNIKEKVVMIVEEDEKLINTLLPICEIIPLRFSYSLEEYSSDYIEKTKSLFSFYYNLDDCFENEILKLKKHFKHFMRYPNMIYVNKINKNYDLVLNICNELNIECINNKELFIKKITNNKKIFLIDSDDTLRNSNGEISIQNKDAIKKIIEKEDYAIICTARPRYHTLEIMNETLASNYIISSNGAEIFDAKSNKVIKSYYVNSLIIHYLIKKCYQLDIRLVLSSDSVDYVSKNIRNDSQILLDRVNYCSQLKKVRIKTCMIIDSNIDAVLKLKKELSAKKDICIINEKSKDDPYSEEWFCIGNKNANKGHALRIIANYLKVPLHNTISIGNDYNDVSMFKASNHSFAVGNACDEIKKIAKYTVSSNNENGVAKAINYIYNQKRN